MPSPVITITDWAVVPITLSLISLKEVMHRLAASCPLASKELSTLAKLCALVSNVKDKRKNFSTLNIELISLQQLRL